MFSNPGRAYTGVGEKTRFVMINAIRSLLAVLLCCCAQPSAAAPALRILVLESAPPMSFRDADGRLTGFSIEIARALCAEMRARCDFEVTTLSQVLDLLSGGAGDIAAVSLLDTPERRQRILFAQPYFRSRTLWFARPGVQPGQAGIRVAVVRGSAQDRYALAHGWETVGVPTNGELGEPVLAGIAQAALIPMATSLALQRQPRFRALGLQSMVMNAPDLTGDAAFGISPLRPDLKPKIDAALERIKRNGVYDRINSQFLPFRVN